MIIDAHQHFWRYNDRDYVWMGPEHAALRRDFLPPDLEPLMREVGVSGTVAVQARQMIKETEFLLELADRYRFIKGVVGWVDLRSPRVRDQLARFASHPRFVGVRHVLQDEPDDQFMLRPDFVRGIGALAEFDLAYDLLTFPKHLPFACELVAQFPTQRFVLDHISKPPIRAKRLQPWANDLRRLASYPNVYCKISGMVTEADWQNWKPEDLYPYVDVVIDAFGIDRVMLGSDWPVCTLAGSYAQVLGVALDYVARFNADEQEAICWRNAQRAYQLKEI